MACLLEAVQWWAYRTGYASRYSLIMDLREGTRLLISEAVSKDWIAEITRGRGNGPGYVLTSKGEKQLLRYLRQAA